MKNEDQCGNLACEKPLSGESVSLVHQGKVEKYHDIACALSAIHESLKDLELQIESLQRQLRIK